MLKTSLFLHCAPPPHLTTKPSRGWLQVVGSKPRLVLITPNPTRPTVAAKEMTDVLECSRPPLALHRALRRMAGLVFLFCFLGAGASGT